MNINKLWIQKGIISFVMIKILLCLVPFGYAGIPLDIPKFISSEKALKATDSQFETLRQKFPGCDIGRSIANLPTEENPYFLIEISVEKYHEIAPQTYESKKEFSQLLYVDAYTGKIISEPKHIFSNQLRVEEVKEFSSLRGPFKYISKNLDLQLLYFLPYLEEIQIIDLDGDGIKEIVGLQHLKLLVYKGKNILWQQTVNTMETPLHYTICDWDSDGQKEVIATEEDKNILILSGKTGERKRIWKSESPWLIFPIECGDLNNDGEKEIICWSRGGYDKKIGEFTTIIILILDNNFGIAKIELPASSSTGACAFIEDIDKDGNKELITIFESGKTYCFNYFQGKAIPKKILPSQQRKFKYQFCSLEEEKGEFFYSAKNKEYKIKIKRIKDFLSSIPKGYPTYHYQIDVYSSKENKIGSIISRSSPYQVFFTITDLVGDGNSELIWNEPYAYPSSKGEVRIYNLQILKEK